MEWFLWLHTGRLNPRVWALLEMNGLYQSVLHVDGRTVICRCCSANRFCVALYQLKATVMSLNWHGIRRLNRQQNHNTCICLRHRRITYCVVYIILTGEEFDRLIITLDYRLSK